MDIHTILGGQVQLFRRPDSQFWYAQASVAGRQRRKSTKTDSLKHAETVAKDWFLTLHGKAVAGVLDEERSFDDAAKKFMAEYETITEGERSEKWTDGHKARIRLHLMPFFKGWGLSKVSPGAAQDYRVHRKKVGSNRRGGDRKVQAKPDPTPAELERILRAAERSGEERKVKPPSRSTLHDEIVTLNLVLKTAVRHRWLDHVPDLSAPYDAQTKIVHRPWFSPDEYKRLYEASRENARNPEQPHFRWHAEQLHDMILLMGNTGLRPDEIGPKNLLHKDVTIAVDHGTGERILEIEVRGKRGVGYCKSMPGAVRPYERLLNRPKPASALPTKRKRKGQAGDAPEIELPGPDDPVFPQRHTKMFDALLRKAKLKFDRDGKARTSYSLRHTYICLRLMEGADIYQVAKNCRTSVEMIEKHYAAHIKNTIDAGAINVMRPKTVRVAEKQAANGRRTADEMRRPSSRQERATRTEKSRDAERGPPGHYLSPGDLTAET